MLTLIIPCAQQSIYFLVAGIIAIFCFIQGAGRVAFSNQQSYIAAISARFVQLQHGDIDKRVSHYNYTYHRLNISKFKEKFLYWSIWAMSYDIVDMHLNSQ